MLNLLIGSEASPSKENNDNNNTRSNDSQSTNAQAPLNRTPLLQKLNRMHGDSVIMVCATDTGLLVSGIVCCSLIG